MSLSRLRCIRACSVINIGDHNITEKVRIHSNPGELFPNLKLHAMAEVVLLKPHFCSRGVEQVGRRWAHLVVHAAVAQVWEAFSDESSDERVHVFRQDNCDVRNVCVAGTLVEWKPQDIRASLVAKPHSVVVPLLGDTERSWTTQKEILEDTEQ